MFPTPICSLWLRQRHVQQLNRSPTSSSANSSPSWLKLSTWLLTHKQVAKYRRSWWLLFKHSELSVLCMYVVPWWYLLLIKATRGWVDLDFVSIWWKNWWWNVKNFGRREEMFWTSQGEAAHCFPHIFIQIILCSSLLIKIFSWWFISCWTTVPIEIRATERHFLVKIKLEPYLKVYKNVSKATQVSCSNWA